MPSDKNQHGQHQGQHQGQQHPQGQPVQPPQYPQQPPLHQPPQQQHGGQTYDQSGQPTGPAPGGQPQHQPGHQPDQPPGQDHPPHRDTPAERQQPDRPPPQPSKEEQDKARAEQRELSQAASIGAQVILDFNSDAAVGARGGAAGTIEENTSIRDAELVDLGFNPQAVSGPPLSQEMIAKKQKDQEEALQRAADAPALPPKATKMSSLAAGIQSDGRPQNGAGGGDGGARRQQQQHQPAAGH